MQEKRKFPSKIALDIFFCCIVDHASDMVCCGASLRFEMCGNDVASSVDIVFLYSFLPTGFMFWHCITSKQNASQLGTHFEYDKLQGRKKSLQV